MRADKFKVADFHCDVLSKMQASPDINFDNDPRLDVTAERLASGGWSCNVLQYIFQLTEENQALNMF